MRSRHLLMIVAVLASPDAGCETGITTVQPKPTRGRSQRPPRRKVDSVRHFKIIPGWPRFAGWPAAAGVALCLGTGTVQSQDSPQFSAPPPANAPQTSQPATAATTSTAMQVPMAPNSPVLIVDTRSEADIQRDLDAARALKPKGQADERRAAGDVTQANAVY